MAEKIYKLSLEQLNDIVSEAVATAIKKLDNVVIVDEQLQQKADGGTVKVGEFSEA